MRLLREMQPLTVDVEALRRLTGGMYVLTIDQVDSRSGEDAVPRLLRLLAPVDTTLPFERTAGDEVQGVLSDPAQVLLAWRTAVRDGHWSAGLGLGEDGELGATSRASRGGPFLAARDAVEDAKQEPSQVSVRVSPDAPTTAVRAALDAQAVIRLLAILVRGRTPAGWRIVDAAAARPDATQAQLAEELDVSRQAVSKALLAAHMREVSDGEETAARLLGRALTACADGGGQ